MSLDGMEQQARGDRELDVSAHRAYLVTQCLYLAGVERAETDSEPYIEAVDKQARCLVEALDKAKEGI